MQTSRVEARSPLPENRVFLAFAVATLLAGANAVAVRFTVAELPPFWGAPCVSRPQGRSSGSWPCCARRCAQAINAVGLRVVRGNWFRDRLCVAVLGLRTVPAGMAQVILALTPLLTLLFAVLHGLETFRWRGLVGALIALPASDLRSTKVVRRRSRCYPCSRSSVVRCALQNRPLSSSGCRHPIQS